MGMKNVEIEAAGGIVFNANDEVIMIYRLGKWDFPKGKIEVGESIEASALREVKEETGIKNISIIAPITTTFHTYELSGALMRKTTYWYLMHGDYQPLIPQENEAITEAVWIKKEEVSSYLRESYPALQALWQQVLSGISNHLTFDGFKS